MYTLKEQEDAFLQHRERLIKNLLSRAVKNDIKITVSFYYRHSKNPDDLYYCVGGVDLKFDCHMYQYAYARKTLNEKIKIKRIAKLAEEIRKVRVTYYDGQQIIDKAILASQRNY